MASRVTVVVVNQCMALDGNVLNVMTLIFVPNAT